MFMFYIIYTNIQISVFVKLLQAEFMCNFISEILRIKYVWGILMSLFVLSCQYIWLKQICSDRQSKSKQKDLLMYWKWLNDVKRPFNPTGKASLNEKAGYWQVHFNETQWIIHTVTVEQPRSKSIFASFHLFFNGFETLLRMDTN